MSMYQLLIIADDFTGALDTGVQLSMNGAHTYVIVGNVSSLSGPLPDVEVLVIDAETRHLSPSDAYRTVYDIVTEAVRLGIPHIFKKTDSALRGNIGSELSALLDAGKDQFLPFIPAFPQIGRTTEHGIHLINQIKVTDSVFGTDPFEPVKHSDIVELIGEQSSVYAVSCPVPAKDTVLPDTPGILVFDSASETDLSETADFLCAHALTHIMAGCAGFAQYLHGMLHLTISPAGVPPQLSSKLLVICGSVNPITVTQLNNAEAEGFVRIRLTPQQKLCSGYWDTDIGRKDLQDLRSQLSGHPHLIIDSNDLQSNAPTSQYAAAHGIDMTGIRLGISHSIGHIVRSLFDSPDLGTLLITGGDTLLECMRCMNVNALEPICIFEPGIVLSRFRWKDSERYVLTKSGGFGSENLLSHIVDLLSQNRK